MDEVVGRGIVSYVGQNLAGMVGRIGRRVAGGSIGMLIGGVIGRLFQEQVLGGIAGDIYASGKAEKALDKDVN